MTNLEKSEKLQRLVDFLEKENMDIWACSCCEGLNIKFDYDVEYADTLTKKAYDKYRDEHIESDMMCIDHIKDRIKELKSRCKYGNNI